MHPSRVAASLALACLTSACYAATQTTTSRRGTPRSTALNAKRRLSREQHLRGVEYGDRAASSQGHDVLVMVTTCETRLGANESTTIAATRSRRT